MAGSGGPPGRRERRGLAVESSTDSCRVSWRGDALGPEPVRPPAPRPRVDALRVRGDVRRTGWPARQPPVAPRAPLPRVGPLQRVREAPRTPEVEVARR